MAAPVISGVVYPTTSSEPLRFTVYATAPAQVETITVTLADASTLAAFAAAALQGTFPAGGSTVSGAGTLASPYVFALRPDGGWPSTVSRVELNATSGGLIALPTDLWDIRMHCGNSQGVAFVNSLIADPARYATYYADGRLALLVTDPSDATDMNNMQYALEQAAIIGIPTTMGTTMMANVAAIGGGALTFANGFLNVAQWQRNADYVTAMISRFGSLVTDNYFQCDLEAYFMTGVHSAPTLQALTDNGATLEDLRVAMTPFLNVIAASGMIPYMYPADPGDVMMPLISAVVNRAVVSDEVSFLASVAKRVCDRDYEQYIGVKLAERSNLILAACGENTTHLPAVRDDILRLMGRDFRTDYKALNARRGWIYFRTNSDFAQIGTAAYYNHTSLRSYNDAKICWQWPTNYVGDIERTYGQAASRAIVGYRGDTAGSVVGPCPTKGYDDGGVRLDTPPSPYEYYEYRVEGGDASLATNTFTIAGTFQIPAAQTGATKPVMGQSQNNLGLWQMYTEADKLRIAHNLGGTQPRTTMLDPLVYDTDIKFILRRNGTSWSWLVNAGTLTSVTANTTFTLDRLLIGSGQNLATFPTNNTQQGCVGMLLKGHWRIWTLALGDADMAAAHAANTWPVGLQ